MKQYLGHTAHLMGTIYESGSRFAQSCTTKILIVKWTIDDSTQFTQQTRLLQQSYLAVVITTNHVITATIFFYCHMTLRTFLQQQENNNENVTNIIIQEKYVFIWLLLTVPYKGQNYTFKRERPLCLLISSLMFHCHHYTSLSTS